PFDGAVGAPHSDGPAGRAAHHDAFEDRLPADHVRTSTGVLPALRAAGLLEPALEALHPTTGVDELLLARVERMTGRADLDMELRFGRPGHELVPARAMHRVEHLVWVDVRLHRRARIAEAIWAETLPPETTTATARGSTCPVSRGASAV